MVICPGIGNHSEKHYIRTFVDHAQKDGYRCAVLNHLGALPNIELTSPRMFTYGENKEPTLKLKGSHELWGDLEPPSIKDDMGFQTSAFLKGLIEINKCYTLS